MKPKSELRFLIVDDSVMMRRVVRACLVMYGVKQEGIVDAAGGNEAIAILQKGGGFDGVLCDWNMPECDGLCVLAHMRKMPEYKATPFIIVTGEMKREDVVEAIKAGASDYIGKPVSAEIIHKKLDTHLKSAADKGRAAGQ